MNRPVLHFLACVLVSFGAGCRSTAATPAAGSAPAEALTWSNPLLLQRADPHVFLHSDGYYYCTATVPAYDRIELRRARTLAGLSTAEAKTIWTKHATGPMGAHIWAPEIHFIDGRWYVYFTAGEAENIWAIRPYVLTCAGPDPLQSEWIEKGKIKMGWESFSLDATTFAHRGTRYLVWTQTENGVKGTNLYIARMDTPWSITGKITRISRPDHEWEKRGHWVNEAPAVLIKNGRVFMTFSASATDANYCLGLLTADAGADLLAADSWKKSPAPVFRSDSAASQFGPGHNSFTTTPDGKTDLLVYHSRNYEKIAGDPLRNPDRATRVQIIRWRADGTPDFGTPVADGPYALPSR
jgi:GH43 family beta-xylosidase